MGDRLGLRVGINVGDLVGFLVIWSMHLLFSHSHLSAPIVLQPALVVMELHFRGVGDLVEPGENVGLEVVNRVGALVFGAGAKDGGLVVGILVGLWVVGALGTGDPIETQIPLPPSH